MLYMATASGTLVREAMSSGLLCQITSVAARNTIVAGVPYWCADNSKFSSKKNRGYPGDDEYLSWLTSLVPQAGNCLFAVAPDVVGDAAATLALSTPMLPRIRALGFPAALVAQNGLEYLAVPWDTFDVLFIGGDTEWKLGAAARALIVEAKRRGKRVHMGRVNSRKRVLYADAIGCDTVDGTYVAFGPDTNLPNVLAWQRELNTQGVMFAGGR